MEQRIHQIQHWLTHTLGYHIRHFTTASADASFRRYFRVGTTESTYIVMDAPPEKEPISDFIKIAVLLREAGIHAPQIHHYDTKLGFIVLEDFGNTPYLAHLNHTNCDSLYQNAINAMVDMQSISANQSSLPRYDASFIQTELDLFPQWYLGKAKGVCLTRQQNQSWQSLCTTLKQAFAIQPQTFVHRDYHARNLMVTSQNSPGVIDFQDALIGPICYDLVSLCKDCYIEWPRERQLSWLNYYQQHPKNPSYIRNIPFDTLIYYYDLTGLQRHLKVLGIFSRLHLRDNKPQYLQDIPLVKKYVHDTLNTHAELAQYRDTFLKLLR